MKVIFLDIDGVLNPQSNAIAELKKGRIYANEMILAEDCLHNLEILVKRTKAKVVLTSTHRLSKKLNNSAYHNISKQLADKGVKIYDTTTLKILGREKEISHWLMVHPFTKYVILDDLHFKSKRLKKHLVHCNYYYGFTKTKLDKALNML